MFQNWRTLAMAATFEKPRSLKKHLKTNYHDRPNISSSGKNRKFINGIGQFRKCPSSIMVFIIYDM